MLGAVVCKIIQPVRKCSQHPQSVCFITDAGFLVLSDKYNNFNM